MYGLISRALPWERFWARQVKASGEPLLASPLRLDRFLEVPKPSKTGHSVIPRASIRRDGHQRQQSLMASPSHGADVRASRSLTPAMVRVVAA